jgi:hypothetical protein
MMYRALGNIEEPLRRKTARSKIGFNNTASRLSFVKTITFNEQRCHKRDMKGRLAKGQFGLCGIHRLIRRSFRQRRTPAGLLRKRHHETFEYSSFRAH